MDHLQQALQNRIIMLFIAAAVDLSIGDPHWLWHPVQGVGTLISFFEKNLRRIFSVPPRRERPEKPENSFRIRERIAGLLMVVLVLAVSTGLVLFLLILFGRIHPALRLLFEGVLCGRLLAMRSLGQAGDSVRNPLLRGDTEGARRAVSMIVGRDTERLDGEGIAKAAVETVAENTSDGVTAPLFYMILFGGIGGIFYKAVNTMDSMTGYKNARYKYFGTAAACLDDAMNYIPARLTALLMILACSLPGKETVTVRESVRDNACENVRETVRENIREAKAGENDRAGAREASPANMETGLRGGDLGEKTIRIPDAAAAYRIWRRDRRKSPSPNSAQTESVCAGALHLRLLGDTWYFGELHHKAEIGDGGRSVEPEDITRSVRLMNRTAFLLFAAGIIFLLLAGSLF